MLGFALSAAVAALTLALLTLGMQNAINQDRRCAEVTENC